MTKKEVFKGATKLVISCGTTTIINNIVQSTSNVVRMGTVKALCVNISSFVISAMLSEKVCEYTDMKIDQFEEELIKLSKEEKDAVVG